MIATVVVDTVVACCDPDAVVLFGSWAKGTADVHSDIDLLVDRSVPCLALAARPGAARRAARFAIRFDLHLVTPGRADRRIASSTATSTRCARSCRCSTPRPGLPEGTLTRLEAARGAYDVRHRRYLKLKYCMRNCPQQEKHHRKKTIESSWKVPRANASGVFLFSTRTNPFADTAAPPRAWSST